MDVRPTALPDVLIVTMDEFSDDRGFFLERYHEEKFAQLGLPTVWRQDNHSRSRRSVLRGLHYQLHQPQGKLVSCVRGSVYDVAVDIRVGSPTFRRWVGLELSEDTPQLIWIPGGFAHGFCALSNVADVLYKCTELYVPSDERGVRWDDEDLGIAWPVKQPIVSRRDRELPRLRDADAQLPRYQATARTGTR